MSQYDLIVLGAGPGGYVAAARACELGLKTALIEKDKSLGGTCLNRGCIPTKALLHVADTLSELKEASQMGVLVDGLRLDWPAVQKYKQRNVRMNASGVSHLMKTRGVDIVQGFGKLAGPGRCLVQTPDDTLLELGATHILLAVGSAPQKWPTISFSSDRILSSDTILELDHIPGSLAIVGGGIIGVEFASLFARLGTQVSILESLPRILGNADLECAMFAQRAFAKQGIQIKTQVDVTDIQIKDEQAWISWKTSEGRLGEMRADAVLVAIGRRPSTQGIGLETTQVKCARDFIVVDKNLQTDEPGIYAIGDCIQTPWLAHVASMEGVRAVEHMAGHNPTPFNYDHTPFCVYSQPQLAWCGLSEEEARSRGHDIKISKLDFARNPKAILLNKKEGFVKLICDSQYGEILGAHIVGSQATELIAEPALGMQMEATIGDITRVLHAHPTLYESIYETARGFFHPLPGG